MRNKMFSVLIDRMCFYFFFFKQKTAYEMRISDWSSDVCSSDLRPTDRSMLDVAFCVACAATGCDGAEISVAATRPMARVRASEIGRASCRERVCQYV